MNTRPLIFLVLTAGLLGACAPTPPATSAPETRPVRTSITDLDTFNFFILTRPTPLALREQYPGLQVVMPGDITTKELRNDNSRYFVDLDAEGRITGGRFQ
ncbi:MAG: hypothetical protein ACT4PZ_09595 [Panacagrimonas sp.]